jgi:hypothetical protein
VFAVISLAHLLLAEVATVILPTSLLPATLRRLSVDVHGGPGAWLGLAGGGLLALACRGEGEAAGFARRAATSARRAPAVWRAVAIGGVTLFFAAAWLRYQPWVTARAGGAGFDVPGWSVPFVGPLSLLAVVLLGAALIALMVTRSLIAGLAVAAMGWALSFLAAITALTSTTIARLDLGRYLPVEVRSFAPEAHAGWGVWVMFAVGCAIAFVGGGAAWIHQSERLR